MASGETGHASPVEECDFGWALSMLQRGYRSQVEPVFVSIPRGARGYQLLHTVVRKRIRTQLALADYLGIDRSTIPYVVDDLVEAGLVERLPDPADRRVRTVVATEFGIETCSQADQRARLAEEELLRSLQHGDADTLRELITQAALAVRNVD